MHDAERDELFERIGAAEAAIGLLVEALRQVSPPVHADLHRRAEEIRERSANHFESRAIALRLSSILPR